MLQVHSTINYDAVVSCVGNYSEPNVPDDISGMDSFPGDQLHCHNYRNNDRFVGRTVVVLGASFSGMCFGSLAAPLTALAGCNSIPWWFINVCCVRLDANHHVLLWLATRRLYASNAQAMRSAAA